ncbi:MAG: hypothetical protein WCD89_23750 [Anaerocolumna sp.]
MEVEVIKSRSFEKVIFSPEALVGFLLSNVIFSPKSMTYALVAHNHTKVGYTVQEVISEARKHGIKTPRLYEVENLITEQ